ncbi:hypothetical protein RP20_CCG023149 [Aedes albopictus]|nr:hypothetical protein RP20_CCG023149 [Aedes albopictus]
MFPILVLLALVAFLWLAYQRRMARAAKIAAHFPHPKPVLPLLGNAWMFANKDAAAIFHTVLDLHKQCGQDLVTYGLFGDVQLHVSSPKAIERILLSKVTKKNYIYEYLEPWLGSGLLLSFGEKWFQRRKIITPTFHFKILEQFLEVFNEETDRLVTKLEQHIGEEEFDMYQYITLYALDSICVRPPSNRKPAGDRHGRVDLGAGRTMEAVETEIQKLPGTVGTSDLSGSRDPSGKSHPHSTSRPTPANLEPEPPVGPLGPSGFPGTQVTSRTTKRSSKPPRTTGGQSPTTTEPPNHKTINTPDPPASPGPHRPSRSETVVEGDRQKSKATTTPKSGRRPTGSRKGTGIDGPTSALKGRNRRYGAYPPAVGGAVQPEAGRGPAWRETSMGVSINALDNPDNAYVQAIKDFGSIVIQRTFSALRSFPLLYFLHSFYWRQRKLIKTMHDFTNSVIKAKRQALKEKQATPGAVLSDDGDGVYGKKRLSFLDLLMNESSMSDADIREEVDTFMFEGHDTTTSGIFFSLMALAMHQDVQKRLYEEIGAVLETEEERHASLTNGTLQRMKYLDMVIKEVLRVYPSVPIIGRELLEDVEIDGCQVPRGTAIVVILYNVHRNAEVFPDPERFDPERFSDDAPGTRGPYDYIPFSVGARNCIGQKYALLEMKVTLVKLLMAYKFLPGKSTDSIRIQGDLVLRPSGNMGLRIERR